jgi:hypothetical protein
MPSLSIYPTRGVAHCDTSTTNATCRPTSTCPHKPTHSQTLSPHPAQCPSHGCGKCLSQVRLPTTYCSDPGDSHGYPNTYQEAIGSPYVAEWLTAIQSEYDSLIGHKKGSHCSQDGASSLLIIMIAHPPPTIPVATTFSASLPSM